MAIGRPNVEKKGFALLEATHNLYVSGTLFLSGAILFQDGTQLSSASGLGAGGGLVTGSFDFFVQNELDVQGYLTSSVDDIVRISGSAFVSDRLYFDSAINYLESPDGSQNLDVYTNSSQIVRFNTNGIQLVNGTGIFRTSDLLIRGGTVILSSSAGSIINISGALKLPQVNNNSSPSIQFGDGDTGFYESTDDNIRVAIAAATLWGMNATFFGSSNSDNAALLSVTPTSTTPSIAPAWGDTNTGIGHAGPDQLSLIAGGVEVARAEASDFIVFQNLVVSGSQLIVSSSDLIVDDPLILLAASQSGTPTYDAGFIIERGTSENVGVIWDESDDIFSLVRTTSTGSIFGGIPINGYHDLKLSNLVMTTGVLTPEGSDITISGALRIDGGSFDAARLVNQGNGRTDFLDAGGGYGGIRASLFDVGGSSHRFGNDGVGLNQDGSVKWTNAAFGTSTPITKLTQLGTGSIGLSGSDGTAQIVGESGHLILSSSAGSQVSVSGAFNINDGSSIISVATAGSVQCLEASSGNGFQLRNQTSTATAPAYTFKGDSDTGIGRPAADQLSLTAGGTEIIRVTSGSGLQLDGQLYQVSAPSQTPTGITETVDWDLGNVQVLDLESATGDVTLTLDNGRVGAQYTLIIHQDSSTARDVIWPAEVAWPGGTPPVISTGGNAVDVVSLVFDGTTYYATISQNFS